LKHSESDKMLFKRNKPKVFCIGFNKTGTTSLHELFELAGLRSRHRDRWVHYSHFPEGRKVLEKHDCYSDGEGADFIRLHRWFPDARFILNTRSTGSWLRSRVKHAMRLNRSITAESALHENAFGRMDREFHCDPEKALRKWALEKDIYEKQVRLFFGESENLLEIDITSTPDWARKVLSHIGAHESIADRQQVHANARSTENIDDTEALHRYFSIIDTICPPSI
jgi:hypothetical protein